MIKSKILVDLPSAEADRSKSFGEWMGSLVGKKYDLRSGEEELTVSALSLVSGLLSAIAGAGINNAISLLVDRKVIYLDHEAVGDDLPVLRQAAMASKVFQEPFEQLHLVLDHVEGGLHTIVDVQIRNRVALGEEEMTVVLSSRVEELRVKVGETAAEYRARVGEFANQSEVLQNHCVILEGLTRRLSHQLQRALVGATLRHEAARVELIRPEARQIGRFRDLEFGGQVKTASYRPVPTHQRGGAYADPFYYYYYDPYYDFTSWLMLDMMSQSEGLQVGCVSVVNPQGDFLYSGIDADAQGGANWEGTGAVSFTDDGSLAVAASIPEISSSQDNAVEISGADAMLGSSSIETSTGGGESSAGFFSDFFSSDSSGSSCGSSCSSSSCGSSCGGGCGS